MLCKFQNTVNTMVYVTPSNHKIHRFKPIDRYLYIYIFDNKVPYLISSNFILCNSNMWYNIESLHRHLGITT